jgi:hypothetical protein
MRRIMRLMLPAMILLGVVAGVAVATPPIGVLSAPVHARGTIAEQLNVHSKEGVKLQTKDGLDVVTQQIVIAPGGTTGWHSHPGPVLVTIKSGEMTLVYASDATCQGRTYTAGESFVDRGDEFVHTALNRGSANLEIWATYLVPGEPGAPARLDAPASGTCGF